MAPQPIRSYTDLVKNLRERATSKQATAKSAAGEDVVPEKDPGDKGSVVIPKDPNATNTAQNLPANSTNAEVTPTTQPPAVSATIKGEEKPASIKDKAAAIVAGLKNLQKTAGKKQADGGAATAEKITPTLPSVVNKNEDKVSEGLPATDKGKTPKTPDANVKAGGAGGAGDMPKTEDPAAAAAKKPEGDSKGAIPDSATNKNETSVATTGKSASEDEAYDPAVLAKIASLVLATEDGRAIVQRELEKAHGLAAADDIIKAAAFMEEQIAQLNELEESGILAAQEAWDKATPEQRTHIQKMAMVHDIARNNLKTDGEKNAYDQGAMMASQMGDAGLAEAPEGGHPMEADGPSEEDILAAIQELVASGQIPPEVAEQIIQALGSGAGGGEGGGEGAETPAGGEEMPPEEKEAREILSKSASVSESLFKEVFEAKPESAKPA